MLSPLFRILLLFVLINFSVGSGLVASAQTRKRPVKKTVLEKPAPTFTVTTEPVGSEIIIDGKSKGVTDEKGTLAIKTLPKGKHRLTVRHEGYKDNDQFITGTTGEDTKVELEKEILTMIVQTPPNCTVWVDGESRGIRGATARSRVDHGDGGAGRCLVLG